MKIKNTSGKFINWRINMSNKREVEIKQYQSNIKSIKDDNKLLKSEIVDKDNEIKELKKIIKQMEKDKEINNKTTKKKGKSKNGK
jgi:predicted  nucleic acid-binding Zn-ribbon protein